MTSKVYRMYTEDVNRNRILEVLNSKFDGFTLIPTIGAWRGQLENSLLIEVFNTDHATVIEAAQTIARINNQDAVAVTVAEMVVSFESAERIAA